MNKIILDLKKKIEDFKILNYIIFITLSVLSLTIIYSSISLKFFYLDHDTGMYAFIGRQIFNGINLNSTVFDNKFFSLVILYGIVDKFFETGQNVIVSIVFYILSSLVIYALLNENICLKFKSKIKKVLFYLFILSLIILINFPYVGFSGNTEVISNFVILLILFYSKKVIEENKASNFFIISFLSLFLLSINLISSFVVFFPIIYVFYLNRNFKNLKVITYIVCGIILFVIYTFLIFYKTNSNFFLYLKNFLDFLPYNSEQVKITTRIFQSYKLVENFSLIIPAIILYFLNTKENTIFNLRLLPIYLFSSVFAIILAGSPYPHYYSYLACPISLIVINYILRTTYFYERILILFISLSFLANFAFNTYQLNKNYKQINNSYKSNKTKEIYKFLKGKNVLAFKIGHLHHYIYEFNTKQKYLFFAHPDWVYGENNDKYWEIELEKKLNEFVIAKKSQCGIKIEDKKGSIKSCNMLFKNYKFFSHTPSKNHIIYKRIN